ncbi:MAG: sodium:proton antiporter, partial [Gammaproteobacteria bacterium]|nr:sodium:proton antiporter [Gammaproteobacteria bacterium]
MLAQIKKYTWLWLLLICGFVAWYGAQLDPTVIEAQGHFNFMSLVPALATLVICFATRNVILALFMGILLGGLVTTQYNIIREFLIPSIGSERYAQILLVYLWALGGLLGMWNRNGGAWHFAQYVSTNFVK